MWSCYLIWFACREFLDMHMIYVESMLSLNVFWHRTRLLHPVGLCEKEVWEPCESVKESIVYIICWVKVVETRYVSLGLKGTSRPWVKWSIIDVQSKPWIKMVKGRCVVETLGKNCQGLMCSRSFGKNGKGSAHSLMSLGKNVRGQHSSKELVSENLVWIKYVLSELIEFK